MISCRIKKIKPEIDIYRYLLENFGLEPTETVFIDDTQENLAAAATLGIHTIKFENAVQCRQQLIERAYF